MGKVYVIGVGMTKFERPGSRNDPVTVLAKEAIDKAFSDAKISYGEVEQAFASFMYEPSTSGQHVLYQMGMTGIPILNVNNNCASGSTALLLAKEAIEYGIKDCALAIGFEKMTKGPLKFKYPKMTNPNQMQLKRLRSLVGNINAPYAAVLFAAAAKEHMKLYGSTAEHFAKIAYKNHKHGSVNPYSQSQKSYALDEILNSRVICEPLTLLQCSSPTNGAAAAILASERFVMKHGLQKQAVEVLGMEMATDLPSTFTADSVMTLSGCEMSRMAAYRVYQKTKVRPTDIDVIELHDCFSSHELILYEILGLCPPGKASEMIDRNDNTYGGKYVVNPSGGLIGRGHPLGATGVAQCAELCWQLRGEAGQRQVPGAQLALQHNLGWGGACVVALYSHGFSKQPIMSHLSTIDRNKFKQIGNLLETVLFHVINENILKDSNTQIGLQIKTSSGNKFHYVYNYKESEMSISRVILNGKPKIMISIYEEDLNRILKKYEEISFAESKANSSEEINKIVSAVLQSLKIRCKI